MEKKFKKIYIEITNMCNLKCSFCPDTKRKKSFMSVQEFSEIAKKINRFTNLITLHVKGEPLMHPNLKEILDVCKENNLKVNITTNGTLIKEKKNTLLNSSALRQLNISLHSLSQNENMENSSEKYLEDIFEAVDELTKANKELYISYRLWNLKNISENDENSYILNKLAEEYNNPNLKEKAKENEFVELDRNIFLNQDIEFNWPNINGEIISESGTCRGLRDQIAILVNGDIVPCCLDQDGEIKLGNIFENTLEEILNSSLSKEIKKGFEEGRLVHNLCKKCGYRNKF